MPARSTEFEPGGYWSHTLGADLSTCRRRVYYRVYGSWGGWSRRNGQVPRLLTFAKNSHTISSYVGTLGHEVIQRIIERVRARLKLASAQILHARLEERMHQEIAYSEERRWMAVDNPRRATLILQAHLVGADLHKSEIEAGIGKAHAVLDAFLERYLPHIRDWPSGQVELIDSLDGLEHRGFTIFASPDLVLIRGEDKDEWVLIDWRTGTSVSLDQLKVSALYLVRREERDRVRWLDPKKITGRSVPLLHPDKEGVLQMSQAALDEALARIDRDIDQLEALRGAGIARDELSFPKTEHRGNCEFCNFRFHCDLRPD